MEMAKRVLFITVIIFVTVNIAGQTFHVKGIAGNRIIDYPVAGNQYALLE